MKLRFLFFLLLSRVSLAQPAPVGRWTGNLAAGSGSLKILFTIRNAADGALSATMDVPQQGGRDIPCGPVSYTADSLRIDVRAVGGQFVGKVGTDGGEITGLWKQGNFVGPLTFKRTSDTTQIAAPARPQTPKPPFPYLSEDVAYDNGDKSVHLGATLTKPATGGPFPVAILITGSGLQDRDETISGHKSFFVIADYLTRRGIAVLRVDDRGIGQSTGEVTQATSADFANDVLTSLDYLKTRQDIDPKKIGLIGHSEGGMIAPMVAARRPGEIAFLVALAGPGIPISTLMAQQSVAIFNASGVSAEATDAYKPLYEHLLQTIVQSPDNITAYNQATQLVQTWEKQTKPWIIRTTTGISSDQSRQTFVNAFVRQMRTPWMRYFLQYDPTKNLKTLRCPVLALNGDKDVQVTADPNLAGWTAALTQGGNKRFRTQKLTELNHLFQHSKTGSPAEYSQLTETVAPEALQLIGDWLLTEGLR